MDLQGLAVRREGPRAFLEKGVEVELAEIHPVKRPERVLALAKHWPALEAALGAHDGPWLCGEQFSYAALPLAVRLPEWAPHLVPDGGEYPRVAAWLQALRDRPSAAANRPGRGARGGLTTPRRPRARAARAARAP